MGADMLGYFAIVPKNYKGILKRKLDKIDKALKLLKDPGDMRFEEGNKNALTLLEKAGVDLEGSYPDMNEEDTLAAIHEDRKLFDGVTLDAGIGFRDIATLTQKINGSDVTVFFAGEMSWGDEPDGGGYQLLRALSRLGIGDALWNAVRWDARPKQGKK